VKEKILEPLKEFLKNLFKKKTKQLEANPPKPANNAQLAKHHNQIKRRSAYSGYEKRSKNSRRKKK
jgi:hypothetical protein